ncbi:MAG TPA: aminopeptidase P N-terminal domain-containing protein [Thermoanaerobaculia bacterium]|nr:aminopeptidase P N-terminal domain-containing protein [Thermoanaerobaculia bacterium]
MRVFGRALIGILGLPVAAFAVDFPPLDPPAAMFRAHREKFLAKLPPNSIAVLRAAPSRRMSNDVQYSYRQDSNFWYLTGVEEPDSVAVFRPGATDGRRYVLFVKPRDPRVEAYEGPRAGPREAAAAYSADAAFPTDEFIARMSTYDPATRTFSGFLTGVDEVYLSDAGDEDWSKDLRAAITAMRAREEGPATLVDARYLLHEMRLVKDADEIALIRRATELSGRGHVLAMKAAAPDRYEFEVQQAHDGYCYANGARRMAYPSIVASGPNSVYLHWERNDRRMKAGDVVLNDSGTEYRYYATDITRTYPVSGRFSPEQRAIYDVVLAAQKAALAEVRPGALHGDVGKAAARVQTEGLVRLGLLKGDTGRLVRENGHRIFTKHGISHWIGLDVHDAGKYSVGAESRRLEPGMVFTIEPGIYVPERSPGVDRKWWNIGVRIEDVVLVTESGYECLSCFVPREVAAVEQTVQGRATQK